MTVKKKTVEKSDGVKVDALTIDLSAPFPVIPLRDSFVFPGSSTRILVGRDFSVQALSMAHDKENFVFLVLQRDLEKDSITETDLFRDRKSVV